jgi:diaminopimelate epimerase
VDFTKLTALGNDFILFDNRDQHLNGNELNFYRWLCHRRLGVGADGVILLERSNQAHFKYRHFNADGSRAEMCGNGARSICHYAAVHQIAPPELQFEVEGVIYEAQVREHYVKLKMPPPTDLNLDLDLPIEANLEIGGYLRVGVPHLVLFTLVVGLIDVVRVGRSYRYHPAFKQGTNVNFVTIKHRDTIQIRTYERGVEDETMACGTGSTAAAIISHLVKKLIPPIKVITQGGTLMIDWEPNFNPTYLDGEARIVYEGKLITSPEVFNF